MAYHELPDKIRAIGIQHFGDFEVIEELTTPFPPPESDHVVVKVEYGGVNFIDTYERAGVVSRASTSLVTRCANRTPSVSGSQVSQDLRAGGWRRHYKATDCGEGFERSRVPSP